LWVIGENYSWHLRPDLTYAKFSLFAQHLKAAFYLVKPARCTPYINGIFKCHDHDVLKLEIQILSVESANNRQNPQLSIPPGGMFDRKLEIMGTG